MSGYWFDHGDLIDESHLAADRSLRGQVRVWKSILTNPTERKQLERFSKANGLEFQGHTFDALPGMIFNSAERREMVRWPGPPLVEFGGCSSLGQNMPYFFGYVAVRHDLALPHIVLDARANDGTPPRGSAIYAKKDSHSSLTANFRGSDAGTPMGRVRSKVDPLELGPAVDQQVRVFAEKGRGEEARRLLSGTTLEYFLDVTRYFDVEIVDGWVFLYAYSMSVTGTSPAGWAWMFSLTSRLIDQVDGWARMTSRLEGAEPVAADAPAAPFYTREVVPTPGGLGKGPAKASPGKHAFWDFVWR